MLDGKGITKTMVLKTEPRAELFFSKFSVQPSFDWFFLVVDRF